MPILFPHTHFSFKVTVWILPYSLLYNAFQSLTQNDKLEKKSKALELFANTAV